MPKFEGLKIQDSKGCMIFLHHMRFHTAHKPQGFKQAYPAGFYSQTFHEDVKGDCDEYSTYWGPTKPTKRQFRRMKKKLRKST